CHRSELWSESCPAPTQHVDPRTKSSRRRGAGYEFVCAVSELNLDAKLFTYAGRYHLPLAVAFASISVTIALWQALLAGMAHLPSLILAIGVVLSGVLACMTFFAATSRVREAQLKEAGRQQEAHLAEL